MSKQKDEIEKIVPPISIDVPKNEQETNIVSDEMILGVYGEVLEDVRSDKNQIDETLNNFLNMVINDGDTSTSTKEAIVNLLKLKAEQSDKKTKIADLMTRIKLKEKDTFPKYLAANQTNNINIGGGSTKRELLRKIRQVKKQKEENE